MGKSKAQDALKEKLIELYPYTSITDEVYIGDLIKEQGYTIDEIKKELGNKPHKIFVDIIMRDIDRTIAFEYHGAQHFALIGNMTKTSADLLANKARDEEKSWILERIGIPLVTIPYDMYIDPEIIEQLISESTQRVIKNNKELTECLECGRAFPISAMKSGTCQSCIKKQAQEHALRQSEKYREQQEKQSEWKKELRRARASSTHEQQKQTTTTEEQLRKQETAKRERREQQKQERRKQRKQQKQKLDELRNAQQNEKTSATQQQKQSWREYATPTSPAQCQDDEPGNHNTRNNENAKQAAREARRAAYREYKESDQYKQHKEKEKQRKAEERAAYKQTAEYKTAKAEAKRKRREQREAIKKAKNN